MTCYAVIDTNVLVSALLSSQRDAATVQVVEKIFSSDIIPVFSKEIWKEYNEVLRRKKFRFQEETVVSFMNAIEILGIMVYPDPVSEILPDVKDLPFYAAVMSKREENAFLVTGNIKHFPKKNFVVSPSELIDILNQEY